MTTTAQYSLLNQSAAEPTRGAVNTILPGKLYQRGQIFTWSRQGKEALFIRLGITIVVNFWEKLDAALEDLGVWYWYLPAEESVAMLEPRVLKAAEALASILALPGNSALVLCEAGRGRSVFFSALVAAQLQGWKGSEAYERIKEAVPRNLLKPELVKFLIDWRK